jgi:hypothetical protein
MHMLVLMAPETSQTNDRYTAAIKDRMLRSTRAKFAKAALQPPELPTPASCFTSCMLKTTAAAAGAV